MYIFSSSDKLCWTKGTHFSAAAFRLGTDIWKMADMYIILGLD